MGADLQRSDPDCPGSFVSGFRMRRKGVLHSPSSLWKPARSSSREIAPLPSLSTYESTNQSVNAQAKPQVVGGAQRERAP